MKNLFGFVRCVPSCRVIRCVADTSSEYEDDHAIFLPFVYNVTRKITNRWRQTHTHTHHVCVGVSLSVYVIHCMHLVCDGLTRGEWKNNFSSHMCRMFVWSIPSWSVEQYNWYSRSLHAVPHGEDGAALRFVSLNNVQYDRHFLFLKLSLVS